MHLLDALRGFAIFGMWIVNTTVDVGWYYQIEFMTLPLSDLVTVIVIESLFSGKFFTIFSLLFGVGVFVQVERLRGRGRNIATFMIRRSLGLLVISLVAIALTFSGMDSWSDYAVVGLTLLIVFDRSPATILKLGIACFAFAIFFSDVCSGLQRTSLSYSVRL